MRIAIVGAGAIGMITARLLAKELEHAEIIVFDENPPGLGSASAAAGAMEAVIGEVEKNYENDAYENLLIENGLAARQRWDEIIGELSHDIVTADRTVLYLNKDANTFEQLNFSNMLAAANAFDKAHTVHPSKFFKSDAIINKEVVVELVNERAFDPRRLLRILEQKLNSTGVKIFVDKVLSVDPGSKKIICQKFGMLEFDYIIVAAGASTNSFFAREFNLVPMMRGVGTALMCDLNLETSMQPRTVYRTVNRGGSQCGVHIVPCSAGKYYIGAGNALSWEPIVDLRFETVRYLMDQAEDDVIGRGGLYRATGEILNGDRARTVDYKPLLGHLNGYPHVIIAAGFNRVGLTMAPIIAEDVLAILKQESLAFFVNFKPQRKLISSGDVGEVIDEFARVTCANLIEHNKLTKDCIDEKMNELREVGKELNRLANEKFNLPVSFGHTPDALSVLAKF